MTNQLKSLVSRAIIQSLIIGTAVGCAVAYTTHSRPIEYAGCIFGGVTGAAIVGLLMLPLKIRDSR